MKKKKKDLSTFLYLAQGWEIFPLCLSWQKGHLGPRTMGATSCPDLHSLNSSCWEHSFSSLHSSCFACLPACLPFQLFAQKLGSVCWALIHFHIAGIFSAPPLGLWENFKWQEAHWAIKVNTHNALSPIWGICPPYWLPPGLPTAFHLGSWDAGCVFRQTGCRVSYPRL